MKKYITIAFALLFSPLLSKHNPTKLDDLWLVDIPEEWKHSGIYNEDNLRLYTFGIGSPDPLTSPPVLLANSQTSEATHPKLIRGFSMGIALKQLAAIIVEGASTKFIRNGKPGILTEGYRTEVNTIDGKLILVAFVFNATRLPGTKPLPNADRRMVLVHVAGNSDAEVEDFIKVFDSLRAWRPNE